jgi:O-methyltransferase
MRIKTQLLLWFLRKRRSTYLKLKGLELLAISRDDNFWDLHAELLQDDRGGPTLPERYNIYSLAKATSRFPGALAEAGVYRGGSAKILCAVKGDSPLYLFDTFQGMPKVNVAIDGRWAEGDLSETRYEEIVSYLSAFPNVHVYKGFFPDSAIGQEPEKQSYRFVHLDLDIYESTNQALQFFYPRMVSGGMIVSHDYSALPTLGVKKAFDDFFKDKKETIIPLWDSQCVVVKI